MNRLAGTCGEVDNGVDLYCLFLKINDGANLCRCAFIERMYAGNRCAVEDIMAAFCTCCGAAITLKSMTCPVCGAPSHGMTSRAAAPAVEARVEGAMFEGSLSVEEAILTEQKKAMHACLGCFAS